VSGDSTGAGLPPHARSRLAEIRSSGTWGSALTADEFAAVRSTGFEPVGQVLGAAVYNLGFQGGYGCPGGWGGGFFGGTLTTVSGDSWNTPTQTSGGGSWSAFGPQVQALYSARRAAIGRMTEECAILGGHGVVAVSLSIGAFPAGGLEFKAIGTAVRAPGAPPLRRPFSSDLTGQDFAKLMLAGWMPAGLAIGLSIGSRHDDWGVRSQTAWGAGNAEVMGYTELVNATRHDARLQLAADVARLGATGVVVSVNQLRVHHRECPAQDGRRDHIAEATTIGTAIVPFSSSRATRPPASLAILSLDPQRRQAARTRIGRQT
jgi:uncharacterized protein YbjQ (UPF0145 family)